MTAIRRQRRRSVRLSGSRNSVYAPRHCTVANSCRSFDGQLRNNLAWPKTVSTCPAHCCTLNRW